MLLKRFQKELSIKYSNPTFIGLSFNDTIRKIFTMPATDATLKEAFEIADKCGVPSVNVVTIAIRSYALSKKWSDLKKFILDKNYKSFWPLVVKTALINNNRPFAEEFVNEIASLFNDPLLLEQFNNGEFDNDLGSMPSFQKNFFRKPSLMSFFKIG